MTYIGRRLVLMLQKIKPWRSAKYRAWIRTLPCSATGKIHDIQAHHITGTKQRGISTKVDDFYCIPLSAETHQFLHNNTEAFESRYGSQKELWEKTITTAIKKGVFKIEEKIT